MYTPLHSLPSLALTEIAKNLYHLTDIANLSSLNLSFYFNKFGHLAIFFSTSFHARIKECDYAFYINHTEASVFDVLTLEPKKLTLIIEDDSFFINTLTFLFASPLTSTLLTMIASVESLNVVIQTSLANPFPFLSVLLHNGRRLTEFNVTSTFPLVIPKLTHSFANVVANRPEINISFKLDTLYLTDEIIPVLPLINWSVNTLQTPLEIKWNSHTVCIAYISPPHFMLKIPDYPPPKTLRFTETTSLTFCMVHCHSSFNNVKRVIRIFPKVTQIKFDLFSETDFDCISVHLHKLFNSIGSFHTTGPLTFVRSCQ